jgi:type IV pilus assembly protein PilC
MLVYSFVARNPKTGEKITSRVQADSVSLASKLIRQQGLVPLDINVLDESPSGFRRLGNRIRSKDKVVFSRQLSTLIGAGLPLVQSLRNVQEQTSNRALRAVVADIITDVEAGKPLSEALAKSPKVFDRVFVSLVAAGEISGTLDRSLERVANQQEKDAEILSKVRGAMVYPAIVLLVMLAVVTFMLVMVLPQVEALYEGLSGAGDLPIFTRILLAISNFVIKFWPVLLVLLGIGVFFASRWFKTLGGKRAVDKFKLRAPLIGPLFTKLYMARFARTGTTMVASGVPLIQTLEVVAEAVNNIHVRQSINRAIEQVKGGKALSEALRGDENFLSLVPDMLKIGEESGQVEAMLEKTATYYEKEVDNQIRTISTVIEPLLMIILGVMALIIVAAVLLPIYSLAGKNVIR